MKSLVVLYTMVAAAVAAPHYFVQPPNSPAIVLDPLGRPLDTAEVVSAKALHYQAHALEGHLLKKRSVGHVVAYAAPAAVSHQSRVDVHSSPAVVASVASPVIEARTLYAAPAAVYTGASAVSHQSRVDVQTSPEIVASTPVIAAPAVVAEPTVVEARSVYAPVASVYAAPAATVYAGGAAVSHQSRVDVKNSPAVVAEPAVFEARSVYASPTVYAAPAATVYAGGAAVSHQSRVDVKSSPAVIAEQVVAPAVVEARSIWAPSVYATTW